MPLIAVTHDLRNRCIEAGISCAIWDPNNPLRMNTNLMFVAVEHAIEARFRDHLHNIGRTAEEDGDGQGACGSDASKLPNGEEVPRL